MNDIADAQTIRREPQVDYSYQFNLARERAEKRIYSRLCALSAKLFKSKGKIGILVVLGKFDRYNDYQVPGMRQLGNNGIQKYINVAFGQFEAEVDKIFESGDDGAIIINHNGQVLGTGIYLTVDDPSLEIPDGAGTRHISAASFSTREDVLATFTLSEETLTVRMWKDGSFTEQFRPDEPIEDGE
jgi:DNA integrity scanning protein DisA with diadenylate cyclase activity